jgi:electron transport complex protein RnfG
MRNVLVLTLVGFISAVLLVLVNGLTKQPIQVAKEKEKSKALKEVFDFKFKKTDVKQVEKNGVVFYEIYSEGSLKAVAVESFTDKGYGGRIEILAGVSPECKVTDYKVLQHKETPGLGDKILKEEFKKQFRQAGIDFDWRVKRDGGFVDEITAATISSRAITGAVKKGLDLISDKYGCEK